MWFHPYKDYVRFLVCVRPSCGDSSDCNAERTLVISGAKEFKSPFVADLPDYDTIKGNGTTIDKAGVLVVWEAFPSNMCRQISLLQNSSPSFLDSHDSVKDVVAKGGFKDGTLEHRARSTNGPQAGAGNGTLPQTGYVASSPHIMQEQVANKTEKDGKEGNNG